MKGGARESTQWSETEVEEWQMMGAAEMQGCPVQRSAAPTGIARRLPSHSL